MDPDTRGRANSSWIWIRVKVEIFETAKKNLRIKKYPDTFGWGLNNSSLEKIANHRLNYHCILSRRRNFLELRGK